MAVTIPGFKTGICSAAADLSAKQFHAVKITAAFAVNLTSVAGESTFGVLQNTPTSGQAAEVMHTGVTKVVAGAAISAGADVMAGADGRVITAATAGSKIIGRALEAAVNANEIVSVYLNAGAGNIPA